MYNRLGGETAKYAGHCVVSESSDLSHETRRTQLTTKKITIIIKLLKCKIVKSRFVSKTTILPILADF